MENVTTIGLDLAKHVFQAHGADKGGAVMFRKKLRRQHLLSFFAALPPCTIAMEACSGSHHWGREFGKLGHSVKLIAPAYVKPFVKRQKNDASDAEAICEAAQRPTMRFVPVKSEQAQAAAIIFRTCDLFVRQRTQALNALRGHLTEFGLIVAKGPQNLPKLIALVNDPTSGLPEAAREILVLVIEQVRSLDARVEKLDREIARRAKEDKVARRLMTIPGIGPVTATAIAALAPPAETFRRAEPETNPSARCLAAPSAASRISLRRPRREERITARPKDQFARKPRQTRRKFAKTITSPSPKPPLYQNVPSFSRATQKLLARTWASIHG